MDHHGLKKLRTEKPYLAHYAKDQENITTTDASKTGLKQTYRRFTETDRVRKPIFI